MATAHDSRLPRAQGLCGKLIVQAKGGVSGSKKRPFSALRTGIEP
jgi:hypothetical protein